MSEQIRSLEETRKEMNRQECLNHGHDYDLVEGGWPIRLVRIFCASCGSSWSVIPTYDALERYKKAAE